MAKGTTTNGTAEARSDNAAAAADRQKAEARMTAGMQLLQTVGEAALAAAMLGGKAALVGLRGTMPFLELYSGTTRRRETEGDDKEPGGLEALGLSRGEAAVVRKAFMKGMLEALEIASVTHPVYDGAPAFRAHNSDGQFEPPQMLHFLALGAAAAALWRRWEAAQDRPKPKPKPEPVRLVALDRAIDLVAVRPGEYVPAPQTSSDIRRYAMRQRSLNQPRLAMLAYSGDPGSVVPVDSRMMSGTSAMSATSTLSASAPMRADRSAAAMHPAYVQSLAHAHSNARGCSCGGKAKGGCGCGGGTSGCSCGGHGGSHGASCGCCGGGHAAHQFPPARYDADGDCSSLFSISCETRWRVRDCLKVSFCDLLRCVGDELCDREEGKKIDLGRCLEDFLCSFLKCLPDAICPPPEPCKPACAPRTVENCHCNFAVGE
jgi:hypothetical protein